MVRIRGPTGWTPLDQVENYELRELSNSRERLLYTGDKSRRGFSRLPSRSSSLNWVGAGLTAVSALAAKVEASRDENKTLKELHGSTLDERFAEQEKINAQSDDSVVKSVTNTPVQVGLKPKGLGLKKRPGKGLGLKKQRQEQTVKKLGLNPPGYHYLGPLNSENAGDPTSLIDSDAREHDKAYSEAKTSGDVKKADSEFIRKSVDHIFEGHNPIEIVGGVLGSIGIKAKSLLESKTGTLYPSVSGGSSGSNTAPPGGKRTSEVQGGPPPKYQAADSTSNVVGDISSADTMTLPGSGAEQASGGASSDGQEIFTLPRPISQFGDTTSVYTKTHKLMTFGLAPSIISSGINRFLTTYLAEIPWHIPAFYMNPSEFGLLHPGARCVQVAISAVYRGSTVQFETASSETSLATLNQINDISVATALNKTGWGSNVSFTSFDASDGMIPTGIAKPKYAATSTYRGMVSDYYGENNDSTNFLTYVPHHQLGNNVFLYNYWMISTREVVSTVPNTTMKGGWPCVQEKIQQFDGKTAVNVPLLQMEYKPKMGYLKTPLKYNVIGNPKTNGAVGSTVNVPVGGQLVGQRVASMTIAAVSDGSAITSSETLTIPENDAMMPLNIYSPIEKSQFSRSGAWGAQDAHVQPSAHIGVQPVPALSTAKLNVIEPMDRFTNVRAYWEVTATMVVKQQEPTAFPYAQFANVPFGEQVMENGTANIPAMNRNPSDEGATLGGLYTQAPVSI